MFLIFFALLLLGIRADAAAQKATVSGNPVANLRAAAEIDAAIKSTLKEGDQVVVDKVDGDWFLVTTADGQRGYIHKSLLKVAAEGPAPVAPTPQSAANETKQSAQEPAPAPVSIPAPKISPPAPAANPAVAKSIDPAPKATASKAVAQPRSILQMIEGHEDEFKIGVLVAFAFFVLGWLCGGSYFVRRERRRRGKLRF